MAAVRDHVWPLIDAGQVAAVIDRKLPISQAAQAHHAMAASEHIGKILLVRNDPAGPAEARCGGTD